MALLKNLLSGSVGSEVKKVQQALIDAGYNVGKTGADGVFGKNTLEAVKQYQKDNGLTVDGIVGKITSGSLFGSDTKKETKPTATPATTPAPPATSPKSTPGGAETPLPAYIII